MLRPGDVCFISFESRYEKNARSTLMPGQDAQDWQIESLERFIIEIKDRAANSDLL